MKAAVKSKEGFSPEVAKSRQKLPQATRLNSPYEHLDEPYKALFEQSRDAIYITTREGAFSDFNQAFLDLFCYTSEELTRIKAHETYADPADRSRFQKEIEDNGSLRDFEVKLRKKDGTEMECLLTASLRRAPDGRILGYQGIIRDISQQKRAEELLRLTQFSIQRSSEAAFWINPDGRFSYVNEAACRSLGYSREELLEMTVQDIDPGFPKGIWAEHWEDLKRRGSFNIESYHRAKDGTLFPVEVTLNYVIFGGKEYNCAFARDITERKRAEEVLHREKEKFRVLVEESPFGVSMVDKDGHYQYINPKFVEIFGYTLDDTPTGREWFKKAFPDPEYRHQVISTWISDLERATPDESRPRSFTVTCKDGSNKVILFRPVTVGLKDQFLIYEDITEKKYFEEQLQLAQKMEALGTLAGGIAHNFNNMLMGIMGNVSLVLLDTDKKKPQYEKLKNIEKLVESGSKLTSQLLGYAREGRYEIRPLSLNRLVEETSDTFGTAKKEIRIIRDLAPDLLTIEADQGQIEQALWNLYVNAADAITGSGDLILKTGNVTNMNMAGKQYNPRPGNYVLLTVTDSGIGMDKKIMNHIFEPFFTTKGVGKGTGLGLASVYGIIKAHDGYIDVESQKGHGTTFKIYLPVSNRKVTGKAELAQEPVKGSETVLLVDDEETVIDVGRQMLERMGYTVLAARSGKDAIELYRAHKDAIHIVILDLIMPEMSGGETYDEIKKINPHVKVLLSSGYSKDSRATKILARGCNGFIQKPYTMKGMSLRIREILK
ncbi:MAG: PAS domain S-box protein [Deltaproteobacteria bacterium]|nr:MAG: PAS domain S-box protein [Deltaproteobacteria bacterium]